MDAPWPLGAIAVLSSLLDSLWLSPGGPVWESLLVHFGGGFGTQFCSNLEAVSGLILELTRDSFWTSFGVPKVSRKVARRHTESQQIRIPTWKASVARFSGIIIGVVGPLHPTGACGGASNGRVALLQEAIFHEPQEFAVSRGRRDRGRREGGV